VNGSPPLAAAAPAPSHGGAQAPHAAAACALCRQKPRNPPHPYCSRQCGQRAAAAGWVNGSPPVLAGPAPVPVPLPALAPVPAAGALCAFCQRKPRHGAHLYCGRGCAAQARAAGWVGARPAAGGGRAAGGGHHQLGGGGRGATLSSIERLRRVIAEHEATLALLQSYSTADPQMSSQLQWLEATIAQLRASLALASTSAAGGSRGPMTAPVSATPPCAVAPAPGTHGHSMVSLSKTNSQAVRKQLSQIDQSQHARGAPTLADHFQDPSFPPSPASLGDLDHGRNQHRQGKASRYSWARASELVDTRYGAICVFNGTPVAADVKQGELGDCWFMSALAVVAERPQLLYNLFISRQINPRGAYGVKLCKDGLWQSLVVDDYFPCRGGGGGGGKHRVPAFTQCRRGSLWVALLEKAGAKLHGSYAAMEAGTTLEALSLLTGAPCQQHSIPPPRGDWDQLWAKLLDAQTKGYLLCTSSISDGHAREAEAEANGIVTGHAYSLLKVVDVAGHRLMKVRNPWGRKEWTGKWSDKDSRWTPQLLAACDHRTDGADGVFCMEYSDLTMFFDSVTICRVRDTWHETRCVVSLSFSACVFVRHAPLPAVQLSISCVCVDSEQVPMKNPVSQGQRFRCLELQPAGAGIASLGLEAVVYQPSLGRAGGLLLDESAQFAANADKTYTDLSLTLLAQPDARNPCGWALAAAGERDNAATATLETTIDGRRQHLLLPLGSFSRSASQDPEAREGLLVTSLGVHTQHPVGVRLVMVDARTVARALVVRAQACPKKTKLHDDVGSALCLLDRSS
jgi:hypothetical protein